MQVNVVSVQMDDAIGELLGRTLPQVFLPHVGDVPCQAFPVKRMPRRERQYLVIQHVAVLALPQSPRVGLELRDQLVLAHFLPARKVVPEDGLPLLLIDTPVHVGSQRPKRVDGALTATAMSGDLAVFAQGGIVTLAAGTVGLLAYFAGQGDRTTFASRLAATSWGELMKFWWWPGLAFAATYYLVLVGGCLYVLKQPMNSMALFAGVAGLVGGIMPLYCYYLGYRREIESRQPGGVPSALLRCPFVMGILGKSREAIAGSALSESAAVFEKSSQRVSS